MRTTVTGLLAALVLLGCERKPDKTQILVARLETMNNLRIIAALLITSGEQLPMEDGALDVYELVRKGDISRDNYSLLRKERGGSPTDEEIERGDYTNFRYNRYRGTGEVDDTRPVPLLWDKEPDAMGLSVVAFNDGSVRALDREELAHALKE